MGLEEDVGRVRVKSNGKQTGHHLTPLLKQLRRWTRHCHGVQIDNAKEQQRIRVGGVLQAFPLAEGTQVIAQVRYAGRLDA
jgi:hypothetical protein